MWRFLRHGRGADKCTWRWQVSLHDTRRNSTDSRLQLGIRSPPNPSPSPHVNQPTNQPMKSGRGATDCCLPGSSLAIERLPLRLRYRDTLCVHLFVHLSCYAHWNICAPSKASRSPSSGKPMPFAHQGIALLWWHPYRCEVGPHSRPLRRLVQCLAALVANLLHG